MSHFKLKGRDYYLHLTNEKTEAWRGNVKRQAHIAAKEAELEFEPGPL